MPALDSDEARFKSAEIQSLNKLLRPRTFLMIVNIQHDQHMKITVTLSCACSAPQVYDMICKADTVGVFQIESRAQTRCEGLRRPTRKNHLEGANPVRRFAEGEVFSLKTCAESEGDWRRWRIFKPPLKRVPAVKRKRGLFKSWM
jgi:hypothetical protein